MGICIVSFNPEKNHNEANILELSACQESVEACSSLFCFQPIQGITQARDMPDNVISLGVAVVMSDIISNKGRFVMAFA